MRNSHMTEAFVMVDPSFFFFPFCFFKGPVCQCINFISTTFTLYQDRAFGPGYLLSKVTSLTLASDSAKNLNPFTKALEFCAAV